MNRASVKLASIDSQLALTATKEDPLIGDEGQRNEDFKTFRFADLCSGPGGFSEYLLWRKHTWGERARGWAMTLKGDLDFQTGKFHRDAAVQDNLRIFYGKDGTGNILNQENIDAFAALVEQETNGLGVGLVSADGGVSVDGDEAVQETLLQRLILCQILTMFMTLQKGGDFVVKIFDIFTPVTAGLVWLLSRNFEKICVMKPLTSRPMNSERYVVCRHLLKRQPSQVIEHLRLVNSRYCDIKEKGQSTLTGQGDSDVVPTAAASSTTSESAREDIIHIVDLDILTGDSHFMEYIKRNNMKTAIRQTEALDVFLKYVHEGLRPAFDQEAIKKLCLQEWRIPPRPQPYHPQQHQQQHQQFQQHQSRHHYRQPPQHHSQQHYANHPPNHHNQQHQQHQHRHHHHHSHSHQQQHQQRPGGASHPPLQQRPHPYAQQARPSGQRGQSSVLDSILTNMQQPEREMQ
ncbi:FtsJ methyltransferase domain-containing protein 2 [Linnemannia exigua]|uniref:Cap-specific mRNA (nucleoside-2'-O-)-methyltransferase 1 n=1 Tax=Linnemannia exigua TaxID=604196 RepID=A0AAD4DJE1_9FUNG|nr:FtsJ methyltransferase domain-containing protein 2 [Linnemannia exigua]